MKRIYLAVFALFLFQQCSTPNKESNQNEDKRIRVIFDTDANNELDDQHALAYLLSNTDIFNLVGITVNATYNGGVIQGHYDEAERILQLYNMNGKIPLLKGANADFEEISTIDSLKSDGSEAVDFLIEKANEGPLTVIAVGKLSTVALAVKKDSSFAQKVNLVWLGSNYPEPGEYNQDNDTTSMNYLLNSSIPFEMVTVRYGKPSGTDAVKALQSEIHQKMPGLGPTAAKPVTGRHGNTFTNFGDYSIDLFDHIDLHGNPPSRPLFDMVAVAILKDPSWGEKKEIPAPVLIDNKWVERPENGRKIIVWENFDKEGLLNDFYDRMKNYK